MAEFCIEIAGGVFSVRSLFESTRDYCRNYRSDKVPAYEIQVLPEHLIREQAELDAEAREEGLRRRKFSDPFLERNYIQKRVADLLLTEAVLLLHGSAVAVDGEGYLFTAKCGTGKSTHTRLWREMFGSRAVMVNDDKTFLKVTDTGVLACGAPWSGKHGLDTNITVPLRGICILTRGQENRIRRIGPDQARAMLLHQSCPPSEEARTVLLHTLVDTLLETVPLWQMECTPQPQAAAVSYEAMSGKSV